MFELFVEIVEIPQSHWDQIEEEIDRRKQQEASH